MVRRGREQDEGSESSAARSVFSVYVCVVVYACLWQREGGGEGGGLTSTGEREDTDNVKGAGPAGSLHEGGPRGVSLSDPVGWAEASDS